MENIIIKANSKWVVEDMDEKQLKKIRMLKIGF